MSAAPWTELLLATGLYVAVVWVLGLLATRRAGRSPEEYFLAGRALGPAVLFMALFGTNTTSFVLVGIPGLSYNLGVGVFGLNACLIALSIPLTFWAVGAPARRLARRYGALTPADLYARHLRSKAVGFALFALFTVYTVPYMVQAVKSAALILAEASGGALPAWASGLGVMVVALVYTNLGGMRATAWTNVFQGLVFMAFLLVAFFLISSSLGGLGAAMEKVRETRGELLTVGTSGLFEPRAWASWGLILGFSVVGFPHMLVRLMSAADDRALKQASRLYPLALMVLWLPAVLIGVWGAVAFPDLSDSDQIFHLMAAEHLPAALGSFAFLAVLAVVMSTLDAQILTLGSMVVRDVLEPLGKAKETAEIRGARLFTVAVAAVVYVLAILWNDSIFEISRKAFEGYTTLFPTLLLGLRWRRFTARGALWSLGAGNAVLLLGWFDLWPSFGFLPALWAVAAGFFAGVLASRASAPKGA